MRKIDEFNFFRELFFALKRDGVEEYNYILILHLVIMVRCLRLKLMICLKELM